MSDTAAERRNKDRVNYLVFTIAAETGAEARAVRRWLEPDADVPVRSVTAYAFEAAAKKLKLVEEVEEVRQLIVDRTGTEG